MSEQKPMPRGRTFLAGKVISNYGQSTIDCIVRRISDTGAVIEVESVIGIPEHFHLLIPGEGDPQPCRRSWQSEKQIGLVFETVELAGAETQTGSGEERGADQLVRTQMLALRAALDVMDVGVVLLDPNMKSQFINRAFRRMWTCRMRRPTAIRLSWRCCITVATPRPTRSNPPPLIVTSPIAFARSGKAIPRRSMCA
jgi:hypothetical protein